MLLSIITINFNNAKGLESTINSVKDQSFLDFDYIVIDGNSKDDSKTVIENHESNIDYWISEPDEGVYHAMNKGIAKASGTYLLFLNSGDVLYNNTVLSKAKNSLLQGKDIVYGDLWIIDEKGKGFRNSYPDVVDFLFLKRTSIGHPSTFIKKELFEDYGLYRTDLKIVSDWAFFIKVLCKHNVSQFHLNNVVATFYEGGLSTSKQHEEIHIQERKKILKEMFDIYEASFNELMVKFEKQNSLIAKLNPDIETLVTSKPLLKILNGFIHALTFILNKKRS